VSSPDYDGNESSLVAGHAVRLLQDLGYRYVEPQILDMERESPRDAILAGRLRKAVLRLNPWISDNNAYRAVRALTHVQASGLLAANQAIHAAIAFGSTIEQDRGQGRKSNTIRYIDFDAPLSENNEWIVTRQFRIQGGKGSIVTDIVLFLNGLPVVVIECKNSRLENGGLRAAVDTLLRYQEIDSSHRDLGAPRLFYSVQLIVASDLSNARYGTVGTPERSYSTWRLSYPLSADELARRLSKDAVNARDLLFYGALSPENLLDIIRSFVTFERDPVAGRLVKRVPRYQQFAAVNKAIARAARPGLPRERGGVIWHTQGSGKSLTMLWLALKLRRDPLHENPTILVVTDRRELDEQIFSTFRACGFPSPERAESVRDLRRLLLGPGGRTVLTTVQKFQEIGGTEAAEKPDYPALSEAGNIFVLTDEAHRTQYGSLAANLRHALPNAVFFAFTGTPLDKRDRSTRETFGSYIDTYSIQQAVEDAATVPIFYERRCAELHLTGNLELTGLTPDDRNQFERKYVRAQSVTQTRRNIEAICRDLIDHFTSYIQPNGFKAQVVTVSRDAAVTYKEVLDALNGPESAVIFSAAGDDEARLARHHKTNDERRRQIARFLDPSDPLSILIVCDMLLTGFDAPIEQVMYLDAPLKEHTLLQAISRVNRRADGKNYGLVVDYWGVLGELQQALAIFSPEDVERAIVPVSEELTSLEDWHAAVMRFFETIRDRRDLEACVAVLEPEEVRAEFELAFRRFAQSMEILLPDSKALKFVEDLAWVGTVRAAANARFLGHVEISGCGAKVRKLIEDAISAEGVRQIVTPVALFTPEFQEKMAAFRSRDAQASELEYAIRAEIDARSARDPMFYESVRERLQQLARPSIGEIDAARWLEMLTSLAAEMRGRERTAEELGLTGTGLALYDLLIAGPAQPGQVAEASRSGQGDLFDDAKKQLATSLEEQLEPLTNIVDWTCKLDVRREMRRLIKRQLDRAGYPREDRERLAQAVVDLLEFRNR
jgi:type I restriction enzyme R subunit